MFQQLLTILAAFLLFANGGLAQWNGWEAVENLFVFGASWAETGFRTSHAKPDALHGNPFGNPVGYVGTSCAGPNWVHHLGAHYNESRMNVYDLGVGGAVVDSAVNHALPPNDFVTQVGSTFAQHYGSRQDADWTSENSLFAIFFAINDVDGTFDRTPSPNEHIFSVFTSLIDQLHTFGAHNFLILNVPPIDRSPGNTAKFPSPKLARLKAYIAESNTRMSRVAASFVARHPGTKVFTHNTHAFINAVLDNPKAFEATNGLREMGKFCPAYAKRHVGEWESERGWMDFKDAG
ncbi:MAG: hypothetical protein Q9212_007104, partial [Teloschistes hypoglaucus]